MVKQLPLDKILKNNLTESVSVVLLQSQVRPLIAALIPMMPLSSAGSF